MCESSEIGILSLTMAALAALNRMRNDSFIGTKLRGNCCSEKSVDTQIIRIRSQHLVATEYGCFFSVLLVFFFCIVFFAYRFYVLQGHPAPHSALGKYRLLLPTAAVRVSPLCSGAMSIGGTWQFMNTQTKENSFEILDAGGNSVDTANNYQNEQSETWLGEWMVIATKFTTGYRSDWKKEPIHVNFGGNSAKSLHESVTDYIDLLYVQW